MFCLTAALINKEIKKIIAVIKLFSIIFIYWRKFVCLRCFLTSQLLQLSIIGISHSFLSRLQLVQNAAARGNINLIISHQTWFHGIGSLGSLWNIGMILKCYYLYSNPLTIWPHTISLSYCTLTDYLDHLDLVSFICSLQTEMQRWPRICAQ